MDPPAPKNDPARAVAHAAQDFRGAEPKPVEQAPRPIHMPEAPVEDESPLLSTTFPLSPPAPTAAPAASPAANGPTAAGARPIVAVQEDALQREAMLVAQSRGALVRGDAAGALVAVRATQRLASRALEPEELSIESRALRALGREDEAMALDLRLRTRFPEHALAR